MKPEVEGDHKRISEPGERQGGVRDGGGCEEERKVDSSLEG